MGLGLVNVFWDGRGISSGCFGETGGLRCESIVWYSED